MYLQLQEMKTEMRKQLDENINQWNTLEASKLIDDVSESIYLEQSKILQDMKQKLSQDLVTITTELQKFAGTVEMTEAGSRLNATWAPLRLLVRPQEKIEEMQENKVISKEEATVLVYIESLKHFPPIDISKCQETSIICKNIANLIKPYLISQTPTYVSTSIHLPDVLKGVLESSQEYVEKILDAGYKPGTIGDDADKLITKIKACYLGNPGGREELIPVWNSDILVQPQTREELKGILDKNILDMSFEEEVVKDIEERHRLKANYPFNEQTLNDDNENLKDLAKLLMRLEKCIDKAKADLKKDGDIPIIDFEFYIPRE